MGEMGRCRVAGGEYLRNWIPSVPPSFSPFFFRLLAGLDPKRCVSVRGAVPGSPPPLSRSNPVLNGIDVTCRPSARDSDESPGSTGLLQTPCDPVAR